MRPLEDLASQLRSERRDVVAVVGAGVSVRASGGVEVASWKGLLRDGISHVESYKPTLPPKWAEAATALVEGGNTAMMLAAAQLICDELDAPLGGEFARWLDASIGSMTPVQPDVIEALLSMNIPILTTNYDNLMEEVSQLPSVTWEDPAHMQQVLRGDKPGIAHLHGHYLKPKTVVLGIKSYDDLANTQAAQAMQHALAGMRTFLFVGFGAGLDDPNFRALRSYIAGAFSGSPYRHYRLCLEEELHAVAAEHRADRVVPVAACRTHDELGGVLKRLVKAAPVLPPGEEFTATPVPASDTPVNYETYAQASLDDWQQAFWDVFGRSDRRIRLYDMMLQLVVESTRLSEAIRKDRFEEALSSLPRILSWICSMAAKVAEDPDQFKDLSTGVPLSDIIWRKYPGLCSLCAERRCVCPTWDTDSLTETERGEIAAARLVKLDAARASLERPGSLDEWIAMFDSIYGTVNAQRPSATKMLHYWEEVGELEIELRKADRLLAGVDLAIEGRTSATDRTVNWEDELADVFSWLSSVYLHIKGHLRNASRLVHELDRRRIFGRVPESAAPDPLSTWAWLEFGSKPDGKHLACHRCKQALCRCSMGFDRR